MASDLTIVSWDGNNINDGSPFTAKFTPGAEWGLPTVSASLAPRLSSWPQVSGVSRGAKRMQILIIDTANSRTNRDNLLTWFSPEDENPKALIVEDADGTDDRYVNAICESLIPLESTVSLKNAFLATVVVHGDVRWRSTSTTTQNWSVTASGDTVTVTNGGTEDAYPAISITPTSQKDSGSFFVYRRFISIRWRVDVAYVNYPVDIGDDSFDTAALVTASKMQADGDDLRVERDDTEIDRWLDGINTATTKVFANLDFQPQWDSTIVSAIASGDTVTSITVNDATEKASSEGILNINSELFTYTAKDDATKTFTIQTRAAYGSTAANHSASDVIWWVQHKLIIKYGDATATTPAVDSNYQSMFSAASSTNTLWVYEDFGEDDGLRPGQWNNMAVWGNVFFYGGTQDSSADPWNEVGVHAKRGRGRAYLYNPCGITSGSFTNGEVFSTRRLNFEGQIQSSITGKKWTLEYTIPDPSANDTWESWSQVQAMDTGTLYMALRQESDYWNTINKVEVADCQAELNSSNTPLITIGSEVSTYTLNCTLTNNTTGSAFVVLASIDTDETVKVDTDVKTVIHDQEGTSLFSTLTLTGGPRRDWLALISGSNQLQFDDTGTAAATVSIVYEKRYF